MGIKKDCFAYDEGKEECTALTNLFCKNEECRFYKKKRIMSKNYIESEIRHYARKHNEK